MIDFVGRKHEQKIFKGAFSSSEPNLFAIIGRRRVGKTFMIRKLYTKHFLFDMVGLQNGNEEKQLRIFTEQLTEYTKSPVPLAQPKDWLSAFSILTKYLKSNKSKTKRMLFFDEFPWISTHRSGFIEAFAHFWNNYAAQSNLIVVICGSAASWMINKVVNNKGGLHNRITKLINLQPFTLTETEEYFRTKKINLNKYQIAQIYMIMGGIPHYLKEIEAGLSAAQNIDNICFRENGLLKNEYNNLYASLFKNYENHLELIETLATKWRGFTRNEIIEKSKFTNGGGLSKLLYELETSSFITSYQAFGKKKKETLYRLSDEYSLFYLKFIKSNKAEKSETWLKLSQSQTWKSWSGFAFENLCLKHSNKIKEALQIAGLYTHESSYMQAGNETTPGFQIDLVIDRNDKTINLCEIKFYASEFLLTKDYAKKMRIRKELFRSVTKTKKQIFNTLITTYGIIPNEHSIGLIDNVIELEDLF